MSEEEFEEEDFLEGSKAAFDHIMVTFMSRSLYLTSLGFRVSVVWCPTHLGHSVANIYVPLGS